MLWNFVHKVADHRLGYMHVVTLLYKIAVLYEYEHL